MAHKINAPARIAAEGNKPKTIEEYFGRVNSGTAAVSIARMVAPAGWHEPGQRPAFDEYTVVLSGCILVETEVDTIRVAAGEAILSEAGEWVRYRTTDDQGAVYVAVCLPAFSPETVHRDS
jgi:quercetin dioxygenase-like cupin family protein